MKRIIKDITLILIIGFFAGLGGLAFGACVANANVASKVIERDYTAGDKVENDVPKLIRVPAPHSGQFSKASVKPTKKHTKNAVRIAVLDTGFDSDALKEAGVIMCPEAYDAVAKKERLGDDEHGHGTAMAIIAAGFAEGADYCIIGIKVMSPYISSFEQAINAIVLGMKKAGELKADIVSMSFGGKNFVLEERAALQGLNALGIVMFAASGNDRVNLDEACTYFPACYHLPLLQVVGAQNTEGLKASYSNYGTQVHLWLPGEVQGLRGTSVSTAIASGMYAKFLAIKRTEKKKQLGAKPKNSKEK